MSWSALEQWRHQFFEQLESFRVFEPLFNNLPHLVFSIKDRQGRYISISEGCVDRCGLSGRFEAIGRTAFELFPSYMAERYSEQDNYVFRTGLALADSLDLTLYNKGEIGWCVSQKIPLRNRARQIIGLACISLDVIEPNSDGRIDKHFADTVDYIRTHYAEGLRVEELAERANISAAQFERRMKKIFQLTPGQFVLKTRIEAAANLLVNTEQNIADIALAVGFCDQSALSRQFRQVTGLSPRQYRQLQLEQALS